MAHQCDNCKLRAYYDKKPNSLMGRFGVGTSTSVLDGRVISPLSMLISNKHYARSISLRNTNKQQRMLGEKR